MPYASPRSWVCSFAVAAALIAANVALASGGQVVLRTDDRHDGYYWNAGPPAGGGRFINAYPLGTFERGTIICGARFLEYSPGTVPPPGEAGCDVRFEDPGPFPTFPDLAPAGLVATADGGHGACYLGTTRVFTFPDGGFIAPVETIYVSAIQPPEGTGGHDYCGMRLDTDSGSQGYAKWWDGTFFRNLSWNHFIELIAFKPEMLEVHLRATGAARFPGDRGIPAVFTSRQNDDPGDFVTDDRITLSIAIDNRYAGPRSRTIRIAADLSVVSPQSSTTEITGYFRDVATGAPMNGDVPLLLPSGRTILKVHVDSPALVERAAALVGNRVGVNLPLVVLVDDPAFDTDPLALDGVPGVNSASQLLGLRRRAGTADDNSMEEFVTVNAPNRFGDSLNVRFKTLDMPKVPYEMTGFQILGVDVDGSGQGLDAIELRAGDPVFWSDPDLSSVGLLRSVGATDGLPDGLTFTMTPSAVTLDAIDIAIDPTRHPNLVADLFVLAMFLPGEVGGPTSIGADDGPADTLLGDSTFIVSGQQPGTASPHNWGIRALLDSDLGSLDRAVPPNVSPNASYRHLTRKPIPLDVDGNVIR